MVAVKATFVSVSFFKPSRSEARTSTVDVYGYDFSYSSLVTLNYYDYNLLHNQYYTSSLLQASLLLLLQLFILLAHGLDPLRDLCERRLSLLRLASNGLKKGLESACVGPLHQPSLLTQLLIELRILFIRTRIIGSGRSWHRTRPFYLMKKLLFQLAFGPLRKH